MIGSHQTSNYFVQAQLGSWSVSIYLDLIQIRSGRCYPIAFSAYMWIIFFFVGKFRSILFFDYIWISQTSVPKPTLMIGTINHFGLQQRYYAKRNGNREKEKKQFFNGNLTVSIQCARATACHNNSKQNVVRVCMLKNHDSWCSTNGPKKAIERCVCMK